MVGIILEKTICEVAISVLAKKVKTAARNINENASSLIERRRGLCNNYPSDIAYFFT